MSWKTMVCKYGDNMNQMFKEKIIAHRGLSVSYPENTLIAFEAAKNAGIEWIETDISMLKDEELIIFHDETLGRTVSGKKNISDCVWAELVNADAGIWKGKKYTGEKLLSLFDALSWAEKNAVTLILEMKCYGARQRRLAEVMANFLNPWQKEHLIISSFDIEFLHHFGKVAPEMRLASIHNNMPEDVEYLTRTLGLEAMHLKSDLVLSKGSVQEFHNQGLDVRAWTVNDLQTASALIAIGVDMVMSDCPQVLLGK
jgi:glycerophosphoryl diester phosphodiesterase